MKLIKIEIPKDAKTITYDDNRVLSSATIIFKTCWGKTKTMNVFPTTYGPTYGKESILYFYYCDELGDDIDCEISKQINNWMKNNL